MKTLEQLTILVFVLIQSIGYSQTENTVPISKETNTETHIDNKNLQRFIGKYMLVEANITLEIIAEDSKMFIVTEFSKDPLILKNETTLREPTRGVDLELIPDNPGGLKFTQNGYETIIDRVKSKKEK